MPGVTVRACPKPELPHPGSQAPIRVLGMLCKSKSRCLYVSVTCAHLCRRPSHDLGRLTPRAAQVSVSRFTRAAKAVRGAGSEPSLKTAY